MGTEIRVADCAIIRVIFCVSAAWQDEPVDGRGGPEEALLRPPAALALPLAAAHLHLLRGRLPQPRHPRLPPRIPDHPLVLHVDGNRLPPRTPKDEEFRQRFGFSSGDLNPFPIEKILRLTGETEIKSKNNVFTRGRLTSLSKCNHGILTR
ncbi:hypothetical protein CEXT_159491 [Caerostris extrusa]|uniref:Uncharacterized protein n=1 Tax=Caerostris extrusa TaxID=172846 RepID=A0AAV4T269_CAEEX|nr:hypothetical protein CEXT_159491 [Caerostris extrusa]